MGFLECKARKQGLQQIWDQGTGDVAGYCLVCENYIKTSYLVQVMKGRERQEQARLAALRRKAIKVGRSKDTSCKFFGRKVVGIICLLVAGYRDHSCKLQVARLLGARLQVAV